MSTRLLQGFSRWFLGVCLVIGTVFAGSELRAAGDAALAGGEFAFGRTLRATMQKGKWRDAKTLAGRLAIWRSDINQYKPGQSPISDRYILTAYAGVVDLRHFLYTANKVLSKSEDGQFWKGIKVPMEARYAKRPWRNPFGRGLKAIEYHIQLALYDTYCIERGREYELATVIEQPEVLKGLIGGQYWQCTPEDLPSSALGAEFGRRLLRVGDPLAVNIAVEICRFLAPFKPAPDTLRNEISHSEAVFGVPDTAVAEIPPEKLVHFSAVPVLFTKVLNNKAAKLKMGTFCKNVKDGKAGLAEAGYETAKIAGGKELKIRLVKKD